MTTHHFIEAEELLKVIRREIDRGRGAPERVAKWLRKQPRAPHLVGSTAAAALLGVQPPHLSRLREQGRLPEPVEIEGSVDAYVREEIEELARELAQERERRAERRKAKVKA